MTNFIKIFEREVYILHTQNMVYFSGVTSGTSGTPLQQPSELNNLVEKDDDNNEDITEVIEISDDEETQGDTPLTQDVDYDDFLPDL